MPHLCLCKCLDFCLDSSLSDTEFIIKEGDNAMLCCIVVYRCITVVSRMLRWHRCSFARKVNSVKRFIKSAAMAICKGAHRKNNVCVVTTCSLLV